MNDGITLQQMVGWGRVEPSTLSALPETRITWTHSRSDPRHEGRCRVCRRDQGELNAADICIGCWDAGSKYREPFDLRRQEVVDVYSIDLTAADIRAAGNARAAHSHYRTGGAKWRTAPIDVPKPKPSLWKYDPQSGLVDVATAWETVRKFGDPQGEMGRALEKWLAAPFGWSPPKPTGDPQPRDHYWPVPRYPRTPWAEHPWQRHWWQRHWWDLNDKGKRRKRRNGRMAPERLHPQHGSGVLVRCLICLWLTDVVRKVGMETDGLRYDPVCENCEQTWRNHKEPWREVYARLRRQTPVGLRGGGETSRPGP